MLNRRLLNSVSRADLLQRQTSDTHADALAAREKPAKYCMHGASQWQVPAWLQTASTTLPLPRLHELRLHTIAFVTNRQPSSAVALAVRSNPNIRVLVLAPKAQQANVLALNAVWADLDSFTNLTAPWEPIFRQGSPGARSYHHFCHLRWLALAAELHAQAPPRDGAVAVLDDDVLLFEQVSERLRETGAFHPVAHAEVVVSGAFLLGSAGAFARLAAFLWGLYALPSPTLADIVWRYGEPRALADLHQRDRSRIDQVFRRGAQYARFSDMDAVEAFRSLSRAGASSLPTELRGVQWAAGYRRSNCSHGSKVEKLGLSVAALKYQLVLDAVDERREKIASPAATLGSTERRRLFWRRQVPYLHPLNQRICFLHLQGPTAKNELLSPLLRAAGID
jgi:hypothetical protein